MLNEARSVSGTEDCLLVVDFLQSWAARMSDMVDFRLAVAHLVGQLREVAINYRVPVLAIVAQNGSGQGEDSMTLLRESSDLEYTADSLCFLTDEGQTEDSQARRQVALTCLKNRWGASFSQRLIFDAERGVFAEGRSPLFGEVDARQRAEPGELNVVFDDSLGVARRQHALLDHESPPLRPAAGRSPDLAAA
jgi:hypothetical protein